MQRKPLLIACLILATAALSLHWKQSSITPASAAGAPSQFGDDRFGVTLDGDPQQLLKLGTRWFITYDMVAPPNVPQGAVFVPYVPLGDGRPAAADLATAVAVNPGSYWLLGNEPNVTGSSQEQTGEQYARAFHDAVAIIKQVDPTAAIVGPNVLNFDFTCIACPGYPSGHAWMDSFLAAYANDYGTLPPIDVWGIHTYPLDFDHFPQVNATLMEDQLRGFRAYLDATPGLAGPPIWDTELGTHWGYEGLEWHADSDGVVRAHPVGAYRTALLQDYMQELLGWLTSNGPAVNIDRWFFFTSFRSEPEPWETVYGGISLLDGTGADARLTPFGQLYRELAGPSSP